MLGFCCFILAVILLRYFGPINIFVEPKTKYYDGPTMEEYAKRKADREFDELLKTHPELCYDLLRKKFESGEFDKKTYEAILKKITDKIEIKV